MEMLVLFAGSWPLSNTTNESDVRVTTHWLAMCVYPAESAKSLDCSIGVKGIDAALLAGAILKGWVGAPVVFSSTLIVLLLELATARSIFPSPLKSAAVTE